MLRQSILVFQAPWLWKCTSETSPSTATTLERNPSIPISDAAADTAILKDIEDESQDECQEFWIKAQNLQL